jgi:hypothetical protein
MNIKIMLFVVPCLVVNLTHAAKCQAPDGNWYPYNSPQCDADALDPSFELERAVQMREDKRLEYDAEFQRQRLDLLRLEQQRKMMELEYSAHGQKRTLRLEERKFDLLENEVHANRRYSNEVQNDERIQRNIDNIRQTIDIKKDAEAARLGVTRQQYDVIRNKY